MKTWTSSNASELKAFLESETGDRFISRLKEQCRVPGAVAIEPGLDLKEIASQSYAHAQGQSDVFDKIEKMLPKPETKTIPPDFQKEPRPPREPEE